MKEIETISKEIYSLTATWEPKLLKIKDSVLSTRRNSQDRTIKKVLGHLIDSTSNNIHRVVHLQYQKSPFEFPNYATFGNNDRWIAIQNYQDENWSDMVLHWKYSLLHFCHIIKHIDPSKLENEWIAGPGRNISLETIIAEFLKHFKLHLSEIDDLLKK